MRNLLLIALLPLMLACGQDLSDFRDIPRIVRQLDNQKNSSGVNLNGGTIQWQGYANENPELINRFDSAMSCLADLNVYRSGYPYVVIVDKVFFCNGDLLGGCYDRASGNIYIIIGSDFLKAPMDIFKHEVIHWATLLGNPAHNTIYFTQCENI